MHYAPKSFSRNGLATIVPVDGFSVIDPSNSITELDAAKARAIYGPPLENEVIYE